MGNEAVEKMRCEAEQRRVGAIGFGFTSALTGRKNLLARSIPGRLMVHHARHQRPDEAANPSRMNGSIARNTGADSSKDHHDGSQASAATNHMRNPMRKRGFVMNSNALKRETSLPCTATTPNNLGPRLCLQPGAYVYL